MNRAFPKIWIINLILTFFIVVIGGILIYWLIFKVIKVETRCLLPYFTECKDSLDCVSYAKCQAGQGTICLPQCILEGYEWDCLRGKCNWSKDGIGPL